MKHTKDNPSLKKGWRRGSKKSGADYISPNSVQKMATEETRSGKSQAALPESESDSLKVEILGLLTALQSESVRLSTQLAKQADSFSAQLTGITTQLTNLNDKVERQELRLSAIESFPAAPISHPPRWFGTETHSVSLAKRTRAGYLG